MDFYEHNRKNVIRGAMDWVVDITVALAFAWFVMHSFGMQIQIAGQSMEPILASGDIVLASRILYDFGKPARRDIVVFERDDQKKNVKRVLGLPGDVIQVIEGRLHINGEPYEDEALSEVIFAGLAENPIELGEGEYFLLGDNRDSSEDSRFASIGNVKEEQILGKVWLRIFPLLKIKVIRSGA